MARIAGLDQKVYGDEAPTLTKDATDSQIIRAWNWYRYFKDENDAKSYVLSYLKNQKNKELKELSKKISKVHPGKLITSGWNCHMLMNGSELPKDMEKKLHDKLKELAKAVEPDKEVTEETPKPVVSIQERVQARSQELIADLEDQIDIFINEGENSFDPVVWFRDNAIKPAIAKKISEYYNPLYMELFEAHKGTDKELKGAYSHLKKTQIKRYMEFVKSILAAADTQSVAVKSTRKPRKKKVKPATAVVSKIKFKPEDKEYKITSIKPTEIVGANQLWIFNTKYRSLTVLNAIGPAGLSAKGTTVLGFDEATSITKKVRKPETALKTVLSGGKVALRNLMGNIKAKANQAKGRLNSDTVILKAIK